ncbi:unnamed protein product [Brassica oleracea]
MLPILNIGFRQPITKGVFNPRVTKPCICNFFSLFPRLLRIPFFSPSPDPSLLPSYLLPSPSISTRSPLPSPSLPPRLASSVTSRLLTTPQSKKTASSLMTTLLPQSFPSDLKLFVGNLPFNVDSAQVAQLFESAGNVEMAEGEAEVLALESLFGEQGKVVEARVIYDRESGRSKGFGFVTYNSAQEAQNAIRTLDGADLDGRQIRVSEAEARPPRR